MSSGRCWGAVIIIILNSINPGGRRFDNTVTLWLEIASYNSISDMVVDSARLGSAPGTVITSRLLLVIDCLTLDTTLGEASSMVMLSKLLDRLGTPDTDHQRAAVGDRLSDLEHHAEGGLQHGDVEQTAGQVGSRAGEH